MVLLLVLLLVLVSVLVSVVLGMVAHGVAKMALACVLAPPSPCAHEMTQLVTFAVITFTITAAAFLPCLCFLFSAVPLRLLCVGPTSS